MNKDVLVVCVGRQCLDSILAQTYRNIEILVSANASTDDIYESIIVEDSANMLNRDKTIGLAGTMCNAIDANGRYLYLL